MVFRSDFGCLEGVGGEHPRHLTYIFDTATNRVKSYANIFIQGEIIFKDPLCLEDCFPKTSCIGKLLTDYKKSGGICNGIDPEAIWPISPEMCKLKNESRNHHEVKRGLCSEDTEMALMRRDCITEIFLLRPDVRFNLGKTFSKENIQTY